MPNEKHIRTYQKYTRKLMWFPSKLPFFYTYGSIELPNQMTFSYKKKITIFKQQLGMFISINSYNPINKELYIKALWNKHCIQNKHFLPSVWDFLKSKYSDLKWFTLFPAKY